MFGSRDELLEWVRKVAFRLGFVVVIMRSDKTTGAQGIGRLSRLETSSSVIVISPNGM